MSPKGRLVLLWLWLWLLCFATASAQEKPQEKPWTGKLKDGRVITEADLRQILQDHELWLKSNEKQGMMADLSYANLSGAKLLEANLSGTMLLGANLSGADLRGANLSGAMPLGANLIGAVLWGANLSEAILLEANLSGADLQGADLSGARLIQANINGTRFQPKPGSLPDVSSLIGIKGLDSLTFAGTSSYALVELRAIYKKGGLREEERQVNFSLQHTRRVNSWKSLQEKYTECKQKKKEETQEKNEKKEEVDLLAREVGRLENIFQLVMFEWTCQWGMTPGRPLRIMGGGIILFTFPYFLSLFCRNPKTGIWRLLPADRVLDRKAQDAPVKLRAKAWWDLRAWGLAFYFSILSAFHIGWRDLNVGSWIARLQRKEYNLRATGWVRTVSGFQSLLSVYMLALWALSYFGRPFE